MDSRAIRPLLMWLRSSIMTLMRKVLSARNHFRERSNSTRWPETCWAKMRIDPMIRAGTQSNASESATQKRSRIRELAQQSAYSLRERDLFGDWSPHIPSLLKYLGLNLKVVPGL